MPNRVTLLPGQRPDLGSKEIEIGQTQYEQAEALSVEHACDIFLRDNTTNTNHERDEVTLFVARDPFQVRPFDETGAFVKMDDEAKQLIIGLNDPVTKAEYAIDSFRTDDLHKLCLCCHDALNYFCKYREEREKFDAINRGKKAVFHLPNTVIHHTNLFSLYAHGPTSECYICNAVLETMEEAWDIEPSQYEEYRLEMAFPMYVPVDGNDSLIFVMVRSDQRKVPVWNWVPLLRLSLWPEEKYQHHFRATSHADCTQSEHGEHVLFEEHPTATHPPLQELASEWLAKCIANEGRKHVPCERRNPDYSPTRLLDVKYARENSMLRIVSPRDDPKCLLSYQTYATLSHCWGSWSGAEDSNLTEANLETRKKVGLNCDSLPATFKDAIQVCTWLNIPYLWIDALCILQDSHLDWVYESSVMHLTYGFGTINISASGGLDPRSGLFAARDYEAFLPQRFQAPKIPRTWFVTSDKMFAWTISAPAFSRVWIHRERQIAPRILHFTPSGMIVWECCGTDGASFRSETLPGGAPFEDLWYGNTKYQTPMMLSSAKKGSEATYAVWNDMCENFSTRNLTVKSDMPIVLSSLAEEFHKLLPGDEYLAGMWKNALPQSLAWHTKYYCPKGGKIKIAPTWSWLSAPAPTGVKFLENYQMNQLMPLATIVDVDIVLEEGHEANDYGPVKSGTLRLEGFLRRIRLEFDHDDRFRLSVIDSSIGGDQDDNEESRFRIVGRSWDEREGKVCKLELDNRALSKEYSCWCMFTSIEELFDSGWDTQDRIVRGILLDKLESDENGPWVRIGTIEMHDLVAFKMRYEFIQSSDKTLEFKGIEKNENGKMENGINSWVDVNDNMKAERPRFFTADSNGQCGNSTDQVTSQDREFETDQGDTLEAGTVRSLTFTLHPPRVEDDDNIDSTGTTHTNQDVNQDAEQNTEHALQSTTAGPSPCKSPEKTQEDLWTNLANLIKSDRSKVAHTEDMEQQEKKREAEQASRGASSEKPASNEDDHKGASIQSAEDASGDILDTEAGNNTIKKKEPDISTLTTTAEVTTKAETDTRLPSTPPITDKASEQDKAKPYEITVDPDDIKSGTDPDELLPSPNAPPIYGFTDRPLSPLEGLYQFDGVITQFHEKAGLKCLRRLDVKSITIV